ncbi:MAG: hypothetical protein ACFFD7_02045 [Candidatus Thorarchaeota archaeon]
MREQRKFDILMPLTNLINVSFIFFISLNILFIINGILISGLSPATYRINDPTTPSPYYYLGLRVSKILIFGGIIASFLAILVFIAIKIPLVYKVKSLKYSIIKKKYGGSENLLKFYREFQSDKYSDRKYKKLDFTSTYMLFH